jgi:AraC family transcriptional regulator, arabinose operon regulatory protein
MKGFPGEVVIVLPGKIIEEIKKNPLINALYVTDIGYYPNARFHYRDRKEGISEHILIYNLDGKGWIKIGCKEHEILPNHFFVIPANTPHTYYADQKTPWNIYWVHFTGEKSDLFSRITGHVNVITPSPVARKKERIDLFTEILVNLSMGYSRENLEYVNLCLWHLMATFMFINQFRQILQGTNPDLTSQAINFMKENINKPLKLEDLANSIEYSTSHFSKIFSEKTGHPPMEYFNQLKMQEACRWLDTTTLSVAEIAENMGFSDPFYFSRTFKRIMRQSPAYYRKRNKR